MKKQAIDPAAPELEKAKPYSMIKITEYLPHAIVSRTILKKATGNIIVSSFDEGEQLEEKIYPFDTFIQIIDGVAEISIDKKLFRLGLGDGIIIPAHAPHAFNAHEPFKMISTSIKSSLRRIDNSNTPASSGPEASDPRPAPVVNDAGPLPSKSIIL